MKYFNLNIKIDSDEDSETTPAEIWLDKRKAAPIFFGEWTADDLMSGKAPYSTKALNEARSFIQAVSNGVEINLVTIDSGFVWVYKIVDDLKFGLEYSFISKMSGERVVPKYYPIEIIKREEISAVPYILAAMKSSQAFARGTFTEINKDGKKYLGNITALECLLGRWTGLPVNPYRCLSSVELETLVAKIFEEHGAHVPAHRGAVLKDVDIFADLSDADETIRDEFHGRSKLSIQVKIDISESTNVEALGKFLANPDNVLITGESEPNRRILQTFGDERYKTCKWISKQVSGVPKVAIWLEKSLNWLPREAWRELS